MLETVSQLDTKAFLWINGLTTSAVFDQVMLILSARITWVVAFVVAMLIFAIKKQWPMLRTLLVAVALLGCSDALTTYGLKNTIQRSRPCYALEETRLVQEKCGSEFGFPSNHAANGMAIAVAIHLLWRKRMVSAVLFLLVAAVAYSRVHLGVHYPLDVIFGGLFGAIVSGLGVTILKKYRTDLVTVPP